MIDLTKPITCNGKPVEVLTGWDKNPGVKFCLVDANGIKAMDRGGVVYRLIFDGQTATNAAPEPNLVGVGDEVVHTYEHEEDGFTRTQRNYHKVIGIYNDRLWCQRIGLDYRAEFGLDEVTLNSRPIEGVKP